MKRALSVCALLAGLGAASLPAANPGDEAIVVFNTRLPESRALADYYADRRQVPKAQVFGFDLSTNEAISRMEFRDALQKPLAKALEQKKLWHIASHFVPATNQQPRRVAWTVVSSKIRYAVLCYGVPVRINRDPNLKEEGVDKLRPEMRRDEAAVDSELALLPLIEEKLPLSGPAHNPAFTATNPAALGPTNGVLLVARLDGPDAAIARGLVDKAMQAEAQGLWGRAYFDLRNTTEPAYKLGDDWLRGAAEIARRLGFETVVDENPGTFPPGFPMSHIAFYAGWYEADASGPFARPKVEFMPGAFAYHLHSFSAATLRDAGHHWVGPLLAKGATCTMGCVDEPYLGLTPEIAVFTARLIFLGFTFGEAAYACQPALSWQTTVVGDPLYRPFGKNPEQLHNELLAQRSKLIAWSYLRLVNLNLAAGKPVADCVALLEQLGTTRESAPLSEKLGDLYAAQGKPSSAVHAWLRALELDCSPQQRLRLLLTAGDRLATLERDAEASDLYEKLLVEYPDYPDRLAVCKKLLPLAQKLKRTAAVEKYEAEISRRENRSAPAAVPAPANPPKSK